MLTCRAALQAAALRDGGAGRAWRSCIFARCFETLRARARSAFQVESPIAEVHSLYGIFEASGEVPADVYTPHAVCGLVFLLLERLALPLIPLDHREALLASVGIEDDVEARDRNVALRLTQLPWAHKPLLAALFSLLRTLRRRVHVVGVCERAGARVCPSPVCGSEPSLWMTRRCVSWRLTARRGVLFSRIDELVHLSAKLHSKIHRLRKVHSRQYIPFDRQNASHVGLLRRLWDSLVIPIVKLHHHDGDLTMIKFDLVSEWWEHAGFRTSDPLTDLRGGGVLALQNVVFFAEEFPAHALSMVKPFRNVSSSTRIPCALPAHFAARVPVGLHALCLMAALSKGAAWKPLRTAMSS